MNMTNQYKILALDLDGTLLDAQSRITPENARAVRMAQQAGVQIVLCTGRNVREVRRFSEQLEAAPDWLVTANGAAVQHPDDREPAFFDGLSTEMVDIILDECAAIDTDPCLYTTQDLYYGHAFRHFLEKVFKPNLPNGFAGRCFPGVGCQKQHTPFNLHTFRPCQPLRNPISPVFLLFP